MRCLACLAALSLTSGLAAQSINPALDQHQSETRIVGAITIPLGQSTDRRRTAPRVEIIARSRTADGILPTIVRVEEQRWQERRIGFTLDGSETLMVNGQPAYGPDEGANLDTGETILVGLGAIVLVGAISIGILAKNATDND